MASFLRWGLGSFHLRAPLSRGKLDVDVGTVEEARKLVDGWREGWVAVFPGRGATAAACLNPDKARRIAGDPCFFAPPTRGRGDVEMGESGTGRLGGEGGIESGQGRGWRGLRVLVGGGDYVA